MAFKFSTGFKDYVNVTGSVKGAFDGKVIKVYSAPTGAPATADDAIPGDSVLLCTYTESGDGVTGLTLSSTSTSGVVPKNSSETWQGTGAAGTAAFFRVVATTDTGATSTTAVRIQGTVGTAGADMNVANTTYAAGSSYTIDFFTLTFYAL